MPYRILLTLPSKLIVAMFPNPETFPVLTLPVQAVVCSVASGNVILAPARDSSSELLECDILPNILLVKNPPVPNIISFVVP